MLTHLTLKQVVSQETHQERLNFTEHFISDYKFSLEQSEKAEVHLITV